ncbi:hypothetical protein CkaCkLH20_12831 [Colletotrichum karsti]|uniref:Uncharacterized protein n=1 Tax=Colletotrichum karsti TaxID=1095194 RepID=A0A9P6HT30_9PEZI|nr:uncharacterized protein CkaCkLH20_12831 [Colletotrichum karsti]KAF9869644.1 hypothetical protein CkaCkLH20_12831 [Colletotrichum karsti]
MPTPEARAARAAEERSRCWTTNVKEESDHADETEHQPTGGSFLSGITVTTEILISPHEDDSEATTNAEGTTEGDEKKTDGSQK